MEDILIVDDDPAVRSTLTKMLEMARRVGAARTLAKPFSREELLGALRDEAEFF